MTHEGLTTGQAAKYVNRHPKTLQTWDRDGTLPARRTASGRRYWLRSDLDAFLGRTSAALVRQSFAYCRVSSQAQRPDLKNQRKILEDFCVARGLANVEYIEEVGGGLNLERPKFLALVDAVVSRKVERVILAHKDRLCRFGFELFLHLCQIHNCEVLVLNNEQVSPEQEMVQDLMAITHCFSARLYGLRNYRKALKEALK
jgi:putative resolvase